VVTITGVNDAVKDISVTVPPVAEQTDTVAIEQNLTVTFTDVDLTDLGHAVSFKSASVSDGTNKPTAFTEAQLSALLSGYSTLAKNSGSASGTATLQVHRRLRRLRLPRLGRVHHDHLHGDLHGRHHHDGQ